MIATEQSVQNSAYGRLGVLHPRLRGRRPSSRRTSACAGAFRRRAGRLPLRGWTLERSRG